MLREDSQLHELIRKLALLNASTHDGKAQTGAILGKILGERADLRTQVKELSAVISEVLGEVNAMPLEEQKRVVAEKWPETLTKAKAEEKKLPPLPNVSKYKQVCTRFSPNPDCVLHLGSARAILLSHEYARMYDGKFILRFEDTDPKVKRPGLEFYDWIRKDLAWLGCKVDEEYIQSDRIPIYYDYAEKMVSDGNAYVCTCIPDEFRKKILAREPCPCRNLSREEHLKRWVQMRDGGYKEGEAVLRVKTDLEHPNPAVRDWPAMRIIDSKRYPHPRVGSKYHAWPLYNLAAGLDDHLLGITHIIRGKEHLTNGVRQEYMYRHLGWEYPQAIHYGRLKITGAFLSKSKIVAGVRSGEFCGWDDPRLATFAALRRRGIMAEAIKKMIIDVGPRPIDATLSWENLYSFNRKIIDPQSERYFFVADPIKLEVKGIPQTFTAELPLHPDHEERGFRKYTVKPSADCKSANFWIARKDAVNMEQGKIIRLMELFNVKTEVATSDLVEAVFSSESYEDVRKIKAPLIQWIPVGEEYPCRVVNQDASVVEGYAEGACKKLKPDAVIQFERFGFVRADSVAEKITVYYAHK